MRRSHLETYVEIITLLAQTESLKLTKIMYNTNLNYTTIKDHLSFLITQGLVEEQTAGNDRKSFAVTQKGINVIKFFRGKEQSLPIIKESRNNTIPSRNTAFPRLQSKNWFQEFKSNFMILAEAIEFSKQFPSCNPKIFKEFAEWRSCNSRTEGYVILTTLANESFPTNMDDYIKSHKLRVEQIKDYSMISTPI